MVTGFCRILQSSRYYYSIKIRSAPGQLFAFRQFCPGRSGGFRPAPLGGQCPPSGGSGGGGFLPFRSAPVLPPSVVVAPLQSETRLWRVEDIEQINQRRCYAVMVQSAPCIVKRACTLIHSDSIGLARAMRCDSQRNPHCLCGTLDVMPDGLTRPVLRWVHRRGEDPISPGLRPQTRQERFRERHRAELACFTLQNCKIFCE